MITKRRVMLSDSLADGLLSSSKSNLFVAPKFGVSDINVFLSNGGANNEHVTILVLRAQSQLETIVKMTNLSPGGTDEVKISGLSGGDVVEGFADDAAVVSFLMTGKTEK